MLCTVREVTFAELLQGWMAAQRYNGADAANALGVDPSTITRWLKGKGTPSIKRVDELARTMGVGSAELAMALVAGQLPADPLRRLEVLFEAVLTRLEAVEARQQALEDQRREAPQYPSGRRPRPSA
jgi:transcriptional regulator with XRE-family HTH domain